MSITEIFEKTCCILGKNPADYNADLHFVTADEIRELNFKWRGIDKATDVLSFPLLEKNPATQKTELSDIVICRDALQYRKLCENFEPETAGENSDEFLYLHGLLHLLGYTHDTDADEHAMNAVVREVLGYE